LSNPKLNLGSGVMLLKDYINFDIKEFTVGNLKTDILGDIKELLHIFKPETFSGIFCVHVIEHFFPDEAIKLVKACYELLKPQGILLMEGPDILKMIDILQTGGPPYEGDINKYIGGLYGDVGHKNQWGSEWWSKWGYTRDTASKMISDCGFNILHKGKGTSHSMNKRDYQVKGIK